MLRVQGFGCRLLIAVAVVVAMGYLAGAGDFDPETWPFDYLGVGRMDRTCSVRMQVTQYSETRVDRSGIPHMATTAYRVETQANTSRIRVVDVRMEVQCFGAVRDGGFVLPTRAFPDPVSADPPHWHNYEAPTPCQEFLAAGVIGGQMGTGIITLENRASGKTWEERVPISSTEVPFVLPGDR